MTHKFTAEEVRANLCAVERVRNNIHSTYKALPEDWHDWALEQVAELTCAVNFRSDLRAYADTLSKPADSGLISAASNVLAADNWWKCNSDSPKSALNHYEAACADLRSAIRYRDEQEKEMAAHHVPAGYTTDVDGSIVKGSVYDDYLDSPDRDEQERQA